MLNQSFSKYYPELAAAINALPDKESIKVFHARDGGIAYGIESEGKITPITDAVTPLQRIQTQLQNNAATLSDFSQPVLIIGLNPGDEALYIFNHCENQPTPHLEQPLWICVTSLHRLYAFLQTYPAEKLYSSPRVKFFTTEQWPNQIDWLNNNPDFPYVFTLISGAKQKEITQQLPPLMKLMKERKDATVKTQAENNAYYEKLDDSNLAQHLTGENPQHKPGVMMITRADSVVTQYSARDTLNAFRKNGWRTFHLNSALMLTPFALSRRINLEKPDVLIFINHLRTENTAVYPHNLMFITWIQDTIQSINNRQTAAEWNTHAAQRNRDYIMGYASQLEAFGYDQKRLINSPMIVDTDIFKPRRLDPSQLKKYSCDVMFASRGGFPSKKRISELDAEFKQYNIPVTSQQLEQLHDLLWQQYRTGESFTNYEDLQQIASTVIPSDFFDPTKNEEQSSHLIQQLFWRMNDLIYRQTVVEWLVEYARDRPDFKLRLYGEGWDQNPAFAEFYCGVLPHGEPLSCAYQAARFCLHLNSVEGTHQRLFEIIASGGTPITRCKDMLRLIPQELAAAFRGLFNDNKQLQPECKKTFNDWLFNTAKKELRDTPQMEDNKLSAHMNNVLYQRLSTHPDWTVTNWHDLNFSSRNELYALLDESRT